MSSEASKRHCAFCLVEMEAGKAKKCGGCKKRAYCSRECQTEDWSPKKGGQGHKNWCGLDCGEEDVDWKVTPVPGKGLGIVALRDLPSKYRIIVEASVDKSHPRVADLMPENGTLDEKYKLNALGVGPEDDVDGALCLRISRVNHSCDPNAGHYYENGLKVKILFAERDIKEGEEICIAYTNFGDIGGTLTTARSRVILHGKWGIVCTRGCLCYDAEFNRKLQQAKDMDASLVLLGSLNSIGAVSQAKKLIKFFTEEFPISWIDQERTFYSAFQVAIAKRPFVKLGKQFVAQAYNICRQIQHPEKNVHLKNLKMYMRDPATHRNHFSNM